MYLYFELGTYMYQKEHVNFSNLRSYHFFTFLLFVNNNFFKNINSKSQKRNQFLNFGALDKGRCSAHVHFVYSAHHTTFGRRS